MGFQIGTDEAGYGPNLGPLVIATSVWRLPDDCLEIDLYERLASLVTSKPSDRERLAIADSKQLHRPSSNDRRLETGVLSAFAALDRFPTTWHALWECAAPSFVAEIPSIPWYREYEGGTFDPAMLSARDIWRERWRSTADAQQVQLQQLLATTIDAHQFNPRVRAVGSKGIVLSETTLRLIREVIDRLPIEPITIVCDKHGGRNHYAGLLRDLFEVPLVRVQQEGRELSRYTLEYGGRHVEICFRVGGESFLPSALASMLAKLLREEAMRAFNWFWAQHVSPLRPTAGYPVDAQRFRADIRAAQRHLAIDDETLWRCR